MKKINLKAKLALGLTIILLFLPLISSFTILKDNPRINIDVPKNIKSSQAEIFDGMVINYTFYISGTQHNSGFSYEYDSGNNFNVLSWFSGVGLSRWVEDETTRQISMSSGPITFTDGSHAPLWIFTNVSLYDLVPIVVDGEGDHIFNITKQKIFNIPGFGSVEVWQLEDLTLPGGIAWYEKSTGILIKGYFIYGIGDYIFEFFNTNAVFSNVPPVSGLFDGLYMDYIVYGETTSLPLKIQYTGYSVNIYNCTSDLSPIGVDNWTDDTTTRIMSNDAGTGMSFFPGLYTPFWIFTNVSLGSNVPIAVDAEGDHIFEVKKSVNSEFPGFGLISIWELEDLDGFGGLVWYEKNSGILLNGTFFWGSGMGNYSFMLQDTNAVFGYLRPYSFTLSTNATNPDTDGIFDLEWTNSESAKNYSIYEYSHYITEFNGSLTSIALETTNMTKHLSGYNTGEYYFAAVAKNNYGITLSNCIKITVTIPSTGGGIPGYSIFFIILAGLSISMIILKKSKAIRTIK